MPHLLQARVCTLLQEVMVLRRLTGAAAQECAPAACPVSQLPHAHCAVQLMYELDGAAGSFGNPHARHELLAGANEDYPARPIRYPRPAVLPDKLQQNGSQCSSP